MELLEIKTIDFNKKTLKATFDGLFNGGFVVKTKFDFDKVLEEAADEDLGLKDYYLPEAISFWEWEVFNPEEELITINERETKKIKQLVENELNDLLVTELNEI